MKYSIIIPTYNRKFITLAVVGNLYHLLKNRDDYEIIVVNDGSTDGTDALFLEMASFFPNLVIVQAKKEIGMYRNPGFARNAGAKQARGQVLCFCDGDIIHLSNPLTELDQLLSTKNIDDYYCTGVHYRLFGTKLEGPRGINSDMPHGSWLAVTRKNFYELGGYDERFKVYGNEDQDIVQRLRRKGLLHRSLSSNIAVHPGFEGDRDEDLETDSLKKLQLEYQRESSIVRNENTEWGDGIVLERSMQVPTLDNQAQLAVEKGIDSAKLNTLLLKVQAIDTGISALVEQKILNNKIFNLVNNINQVAVSSIDTIFVPKKLTGVTKPVFDFINLNIVKTIYSDFGAYSGNTVELKHDHLDLVILSQIHRQRNVGEYLDRAFESLKIGGQLIMLCPYYSNCVGSGNTNSLWNAGYLIYNLILAGFDCKKAKVSTFKNEIQLYLSKSDRLIPINKSLDSLVDFFPFDVYQHFNGNILEANWK